MLRFVKPFSVFFLLTFLLVESAWSRSPWEVVYSSPSSDISASALKNDSIKNNRDVKKDTDSVLGYLRTPYLDSYYNNDNRGVYTSRYSGSAETTAESKKSAKDSNKEFHQDMDKVWNSFYGIE